MMLMMTLKAYRCSEAYDILRLLFHEICGNIVDAGNALWFGLYMYAISAVFMFFLALKLSRAAQTAAEVDDDVIVSVDQSYQQDDSEQL